MKELIEIQYKLKAPKGQYNSFGKYKYRSCEDILEALKPLLYEHKCRLTIADDMVAVGPRIYVKATATLVNPSGDTVITTAFAREEETKKGMDASQVTGAASSYARKYALNGMFCIDDTKDSDDTNTGQQQVSEPSPSPPDNRKTLPKDKFNDPSVMKWIYDSLANARQKGQMMSLYNLVTHNYKVTEADLQEISANYDQYRVNNNLP